MNASAKVLLALLLLSLPALAQGSDGGGTIRGQILPAQGESDLPGIVMVKIVGPGFQQVTYASGSFFSFEGVRDGNYTIYVGAAGREEVVHELHGFTADRNDLVTIVMGSRIAQGDEPPPGNAVVDVKTLQVPNKAHEQLKKGIEFLNKMEFAKAVQHFEAAVQICPQFYQAHNNLGVAHLRMNQMEEAEKEFARAVEIQPDNVIALKNLAYIRMNRGRYREAIGPLAKAVRLDGNDAKTEMYLGEAYTMEKDPVKAKDHFLKAVVLDPGLAHAHYRLGYISLAEKRYDEALKHFQGFLKLNPENGKEEVQARVRMLQRYFKDSLARGAANPMP
ncbi:MAG: tetratricopeptide repeat protein [Acidobacteriota bacterium]